MPKFIGTNKLKDNIFIEFINGQRLDEIKGLKLEQKVNIIFEIMIVIEYIHRKHYVYRDLKPDNIMIDNHEIAVLIDFDRMISIDSVLNDSELSNDFGSFLYVQPENLTIENAYKGDIYSLGKVIYYIMNEQIPINDINNYPKMKEIYENCTKIDPKERPTIKELMLDFYIEFRPDIFHHELIIKDYFTEVFNKEIADVISMLKATNFDPLYIYNFGVLFYEGKYIKKNIEKAIYYFDIAANLGEEMARFKLGDMYYNGIEVKQNIKKAIYSYSLNISQNEKHDNFILGTIYYDNKYIQRDIKKAHYFFKLAADDGHNIACMYLAEIYYFSDYYKHDINKAIHYLKIAADNGFVDAQIDLWELLYYGEKVPQNIDMAIYYLKLAADQNDPKAQYYLGRISYDEGKDERDINKAIYYLTLSAQQNYSDAQNILGYIFLKGEVVKKNINKAINYFLLAANNGNTNAQYNLGFIYYNGNGVKKDINKAIYYFKLAANDFSCEANFILGFIYQTESEIKNISNAIYHYKISAKYNNYSAFFNLGIIYYLGYGIPKDINLAIKYFEQSANQNHLESLDMLGKIYIIDLKDIDKGLEYLTLASNQNYSDSEMTLGLLYSQGKYLKIDYIKSLKYFVSAANHGNSNAKMYLGIFGLCGLFDSSKSFEYFYQSKNDSIESQFYGIHVKQNTKIALRYIVESANNHFRYAYFMAGFLYHISGDIKNAIYYYNESSSLKRHFAKNNLGIIYKNCKDYQNIEHAILFLKEAIEKADDLIPLYNLANLYFFNDNFIESIELLVKCDKGFNYIDELLCLASMMEFGFEIENIKEELDKYNKNVSRRICEMIKRRHLNDDSAFEKLYKWYEKSDIIYAFEQSNNCILIKYMEEYNNKINKRIKNINESFYEGFGIEIT